MREIKIGLDTSVALCYSCIIKSHRRQEMKTESVRIGENLLTALRKEAKIGNRSLRAQIEMTLRAALESQVARKDK